MVKRPNEVTATPVGPGVGIEGAAQRRPEGFLDVPRFLLGALQSFRARLPGKVVGNLASVVVLAALFVLVWPSWQGVATAVGLCSVGTVEYLGHEPFYVSSIDYAERSRYPAFTPDRAGRSGGGDDFGLTGPGCRAPSSRSPSFFHIRPSSRS